MSMYGPAGVSDRPRHRVRTAVVLVLALGLLVGSGVAAVQALRSPSPASTPAPRACAAVARGQLPPQRVVVNVYNTSRRPGLAAAVAGELRARGFAVAAVANDPRRQRGVRTAGLRYGAEGRPAVRTLLTVVPRARTFPERRRGDTVDLLLGADFVALAPAPRC